MSRLLCPLVCLAASLSVACTSEPTEPNDAEAGNAGEAGSSASAAGGGAPRTCPEGPSFATDTQPVSVGLVEGQMVDEQGEPTSAGLVQVCGKNICTNARVTDNGRLAEAIDQSMDAPACKFGDGKAWGKLALPIGEGDSQLGTLTAVRLPAFADGAPLSPDQVASSGGVTLALDPSASVQIDTLSYETEAEHGFRAAQLPEAALAQLNQDFVLGFVLAPVETRICPSPALSLQNTPQLAPGTELELFLLGLDVLEPWAPYGGWRKVGEGQVTPDGETLEFPEGVPLLTAIGVREKG